MLNYIALYCAHIPGGDQGGVELLCSTLSLPAPPSAVSASLASFPGISIGKFNLNVCVILTFVIGVLVFIYLKYTKHGYEIAVVGDSVGTARYAGIKVNRVVLRTVFLSACLIGLAAAFKVGTAGILSTAITDDVGWTGVIVAWLAKLNTVGIFLVSALIGVLRLRLHRGRGHLLRRGLQLCQHASGRDPVHRCWRRIFSSASGWSLPERGSRPMEMDKTGCRHHLYPQYRGV